MTRTRFLSTLCGLPMVASIPPATELDDLIEAYCKAANRLARYREEHGFVPGARVKCVFAKQTPKYGVIRQYGDGWDTCAHFHVPVLLDNGRRQPWDMGDLTIL